MAINRREFTKWCSLLGVPFLFQPVTLANNLRSDRRSETVVIVGAGAAGLAAGYWLKQQGVDVQILEASSGHGGRMKRVTDFADFPIPLGAEWIHVEPEILGDIVNDESVKVTIDTTKYDPDVDYGWYEGEEISLYDAEMEGDSKFINATWYDFFHQYIVPSIESRITYNSVVEKIDYSADKIQVITHAMQYAADRVIVTVPVKLLQRGDITFVPELPKYKRRAIRDVRVWGGFKAFIQFSEKFYPPFVAFNPPSGGTGEKLYYDAAYGQNTTQHILGLFAVGNAASPYLELDDGALIQFILNEIDELSEGQASERYIKHIFQNWDSEPYADGAYVMDGENWRVLKRLGQSVDERVFFAGDAYTEGDDWGSVHAAVYSARRAVEEILLSNKG